MRCKAGDLAVVVFSQAGNEGVILTCIRRATLGEMEAKDYGVSRPMWHTDREMGDTWGTTDNLMFDAYLKPLHGGPGADETLSWKAVPLTPASKRLTEAEFEAAQDRWIQGVEL